jgi:hypothetical protein
MRHHVGWYTDNQSLKPIGQNGALIEFGKAAVIDTPCTVVNRQMYAA